MELHSLKMLITLWLAVGAVGLAAWALYAWASGRPLGGGYAGLLRFVHLLVALQIALGLVLYSRGFRPGTMHMVYGMAMGATAIAQYATRPRPAAPGGRGPVWALTLALIMLGLVARAWLTSAR